jgi:actin related protein 2/3 complex subunit 1A/1B
VTVPVYRWVSKHVKKPLRSTVLSICWHPNNYLLAAGSCDFKARVFSGYVKEIEEKPEATCWGKKMTFGFCMAEFSNGGGGWVHDVSFSPSGDKLAWVSHDSSVSVVNQAAEGQVTTVSHSYLPYLSCLFLTESSLVVAGFDCCPVLWMYDDRGQLTYINKLDQTEKKQQEFVSAMDKFKGLDKRATAGARDVELDSTHQNAILEILPHTGPRENVSKFASIGVDGQLVIWDCKSLESSIGGLRFK